MKKLMFIATAALCGAVMAEDAGTITSANVVGYTNKELAGGFTQVTPEFVTVGGAKEMLLENIKGTFAEFDSIQIFGNGGDVDTEVFYFEEGSMLPEGTPTGWYTGDQEPAGTTALAAGQEFWFNLADVGSVTGSGEVNRDPVTVNLVNGFTPVGNCTPVDRTIADLTFTGLNEFDSVQIFDGNGDVETEIFYFEEGSMLPEGTPTGWYTGDQEPAGTTALAAGRGFWVNCSADEATVTIPAAL